MTEAEKSRFAANAQRLVRVIVESNNVTVVSMLQPRLLDCDPAAESLTLAFAAQPWARNPNGAIHGGIVSTMFDTAMGLATYAAADVLTPTMSLTTSFLRPVPGEGWIVVRAVITRTGRSVLYASAEMWAEAAPEKIVATAQGVFHRPIRD